MKQVKTLILSLILLLQLGLIAQESKQPGLFSSRPRELRGDDPPLPPDPHGGETPIGSDLLVLTCLSLGYACIKHSHKEDN